MDSPSRDAATVRRFVGGWLARLSWWLSKIAYDVLPVDEEAKSAPKDLTIAEHLEWDYRNAQVPDE